MGNEQGSVLNREALESPSKITWSDTKCKEFQGREGHAACAVNNKVYSYGGSGLNHLFELAVFDIEDGRWRDISCHGDAPGSLCNASLTAIGCRIYLFGGLNNDMGWNNDMWCFNSDTETWGKIQTSGIKPSPRDKHSAVLWGTKIVIFGGFGPATEAESTAEEEGSAQFTWFNDVFLFDTETGSWEAPNVPQVGVPVPRAAHTATVYGDRMIVFGGKDCKARNQDLNSLDLKTLQWSTVKDAGARPPPSSFHSAAQYGQFMVTCGGRLNDNTHINQLNVLDCESGGWYSPAEGDLPVARGNCSLTLLDNGTAVLLGGSDKFNLIEQCCSEFDTTIYHFKCTLLKSIVVPEPTTEPEATMEGGSTEVGAKESVIEAESDTRDAVV